MMIWAVQLLGIQWLLPFIHAIRISCIPVPHCVCSGAPLVYALTEVHTCIIVSFIPFAYHAFQSLVASCSAASLVYALTEVHAWL